MCPTNGTLDGNVGAMLCFEVVDADFVKVVVATCLVVTALAETKGTCDW